MFTRLRAFCKTLRFRIIAIAVLCWLVPTLVLGAYLGSVFFSALRRETEALLSSSAGHAQLMCLQEIDRLLALARDVTYDNTLENAESLYRASGDFTDFYNTGRSYIQQKFTRERTVTFATFFLLSDPDRLMSTSDSLSDTQEFLASAQGEVLVLGETLDTRCHFAYIHGVPYLVRNLYDKRMERFGMLVLGVNMDRLLSAFLEGEQMWSGTRLDLQLGDYAYVYDGELPAVTVQQGEGLYEQQGYIYCADAVSQYDYTFGYRVSVAKSVVYSEVEQFSRLMAALLLLLVPIAGAILLFAHRRITRPMALLSQATGRMEAGELGVTVSMQGSDEIGQLAHSFNAMSLRIHELIEKSYKEEIILRDARIEAMQSRINPHFLNNALEMINWQSRMEGSETISAMIEALSVLLNASMDRSGDRVVPLSDELGVADAYFYFIQQRFGPKLTAQKEIDDSLLSIPVPRMVVQALLENAVEHGLSPAGGGWIRLGVYARNGFLYIDVTNNGRRVTKEDQERIRTLLTHDDRDIHSEHLGIRNVSQRLALIYGPTARLTISPDEHGDTLARIVIPLAKGPKEEKP